MSLWAKRWKRVFNILLKTFHKTLMLFCFGFFLCQNHTNFLLSVELKPCTLKYTPAEAVYGMLSFTKRVQNQISFGWIMSVIGEESIVMQSYWRPGALKLFFVNSVMKSWNKAPSACLILKYMCWKPHETLFKSLWGFFIHADLAIISSAVQLC